MKKVIVALTWLVAILVPVMASAIREGNDGKFKYRYNMDIHGYEIYGYIEDADTLRIPEEYGSFTVIGIADEAFAGMKSLVCAIIPENICHVGNDIFTGCTSLETLILEPTSTELTEIDSSLSGGGGRLYFNGEADKIPLKSVYIGRPNCMFARSNTLEEVTYSKYARSTNFLGSYCCNVKRVTIEDGKDPIKILDRSFYSTDRNGYITWRGKLTDIYIGRPITGQTLRSLQTLRNVTLGKSIKSWPIEGFLEGCRKLQTLDLSATGITSIEKDQVSKASMKHLILPKGLTTIGEEAFFAMTLDELMIPASVKEIGAKALERCTIGTLGFEGTPKQSQYLSLSLDATAMGDISIAGDEVVRDRIWCKFRKLYIDNGDIRFEPKNWNSSGIEEVEFGPNIRKVPDYLCYGSKVEEVVFPDNIESIGRHAFDKCDNLEFVTMSAGLKSIGAMAFVAPLFQVELPDGVRYIGKNALCHTAKHTAKPFVVPASLYEIEEGGLPPAKEMVIADSEWPVTLSKAYTGVDKLYIGRPVKTHGAVGIGSIPGELEFGPNVTDLPDYCFFESDGATSITLSGSVKRVGASAFARANLTTFKALGLESVSDMMFQDCTALESVEMSDDIRSIGQKAFYGCSNLKKLHLGSGCTTIGEYAFFNCTGLRDIDLGSSLEEIGAWAFVNSVNLKELTLPATLKSMGQYVFCGSGLATLHVKAVEPPTAESTTFYEQFNIHSMYGRDDVIVYVPKQSVGAYRSRKGWLYLNNIVADPSGAVDGVVADGGITVVCRDGVLSVEGAGTVPVQVYDAAGRCVTADYDGRRLSVGLYVVKAGNHVAKIMVH